MYAHLYTASKNNWYILTIKVILTKYKINESIVICKIAETFLKSNKVFRRSPLPPSHNEWCEFKLVSCNLQSLVCSLCSTSLVCYLGWILFLNGFPSATCLTYHHKQSSGIKNRRPWCWSWPPTRSLLKC